MTISKTSTVSGVMAAVVFSVASSAALAGKGIQGSGLILAAGESAQSQRMENSRKQYQKQQGKAEKKAEQAADSDQAQTQEQVRQKIQINAQDRR